MHIDKERREKIDAEKVLKVEIQKKSTVHSFIHSFITILNMSEMLNQRRLMCDFC